MDPGVGPPPQDRQWTLPSARRVAVETHQHRGLHQHRGGVPLLSLSLFFPPPFLLLLGCIFPEKNANHVPNWEEEICNKKGMLPPPPLLPTTATSSASDYFLLSGLPHTHTHTRARDINAAQFFGPSNYSTTTTTTKVVDDIAC